jgi:sugar lactone lactonase YvrE
MVTVRGKFYAVEPNHGEVDVITPSGGVSRLIDVSASQQHVVPTAIAYHGNFYLGNLGTFPVNPGTQKVYKVTPSGNIQAAASGLTTVVGVAFDARGRMYALETDTVPGFPGPAAAGSGTVVRVEDDGHLTPLATGLVFPTAMTFGPDGMLYISNVGFGVPVVGAGQVVRVSIPQ